MSISIIIPVYNEILNLNGTYKNLSKAIDLINLKDYEIIFINDCSTDDSLSKLQELSIKNKNIIIINNETNIGLSNSIQKGIKFSKKKYIWWMPSDNNLKSEEITKMIEKYYNYDFIFTKHVIERGIFRKFVSNSFTILVNIVFNLKMPYYNSLFLIKKEHFKKIEIKSESQFWMAELTIKLLSLNKKYEIRTLKLNERKSGKSSIFNFYQLYRTILDLFKIRFNLL